MSGMELAAKANGACITAEGRVISPQPGLGPWLGGGSFLMRQILSKVLCKRFKRDNLVTGESFEKIFQLFAKNSNPLQRKPVK